MEIKGRRFARKKEIVNIRKKIEGNFVELAYLVDRKEKVEIAGTSEDFSLVLIGGIPYFFEKDGDYFPTLKGLLRMGDITNKYVVVDRGAIAFVTNGADIMRPGVVEMSGDIKNGDFVVILEEGHRKPIAFGKSLWDYEDFLKKSSGKCIKNLHYVGDKVWKMEV